jgi:hypothetical protein
MRIGILGSELMGGKLGMLFARAGHEVVFSYARSKEKLKRLARNGRLGAGRDLCPGGPQVSCRPRIAQPGMGGADPLLAAHGVQCPQPGPGQDKDRGRAGREVHDPSGSLAGSAPVPGSGGG